MVIKKVPAFGQGLFANFFIDYCIFSPLLLWIVKISEVICAVNVHFLFCVPNVQTKMTLSRGK